MRVVGCWTPAKRMTTPLPIEILMEMSFLLLPVPGGFHTVQGAVATWRLWIEYLRTRRVATAPCTVPKKISHSVRIPSHIARTQIFFGYWVYSQTILRPGGLPRLLPLAEFDLL